MFFKCSKEPYHGDTPKNCHITVSKNIFLKITHSYLEASHSVGSVVLIKDNNTDKQTENHGLSFPTFKLLLFKFGLKHLSGLLTCLKGYHRSQPCHLQCHRPIILPSWDASLTLKYKQL